MEPDSRPSRTRWHSVSAGITDGSLDQFPCIAPPLLGRSGTPTLSGRSGGSPGAMRGSASSLWQRLPGGRYERGVQSVTVPRAFSRLPVVLSSHRRQQTPHIPTHPAPQIHPRKPTPNNDSDSAAHPREACSGLNAIATAPVSAQARIFGLRVENRGPCTVRLPPGSATSTAPSAGRADVPPGMSIAPAARRRRGGCHVVAVVAVRLQPPAPVVRASEPSSPGYDWSVASSLW